MGMCVMLRRHITQPWVCWLMIFTFVSSILTTCRNLTIRFQEIRSWTLEYLGREQEPQCCSQFIGKGKALLKNVVQDEQEMTPYTAQLHLVRGLVTLESSQMTFLANGTVVLWLHHGVIIYCKTVQQLLILIILNPMLTATIALSIGGLKMFVWGLGSPIFHILQFQFLMFTGFNSFCLLNLLFITLVTL